jgi:phospholipase/carboxylesterase
MAGVDLIETFVPGDAERAPVVLLHGAGGTESDLMALAAEVAPGSARLGLRGAVPVGRGFAFFRRFPDLSVDEDDLGRRVPGVAETIERSCVVHGLKRRPFAIGFSNGAIMATALLMTHPDLLAGAILFRPRSPFAQDPAAPLDETPVLIVDGAKDPRRSPGEGFELAARLRRSGARVTQHELPVGHSITPDDRVLAQEWFRALD